MSTRPKGASGTCATPSRLVFTFNSIVLFFLILCSSTYLKYTLAFSTGVSFSPPVTSIVMRDCGSGLVAEDFGSGDEAGGFCAAIWPTKVSAAGRRAHDRSRIREKFLICVNTIL